ncbi:hypothetical protein [Burkholderia ambifaria]|uniref:hypothetical protein n=1 Tax=Burkholderia ambifaria TaxID=152480 RepID=UPI001BA260D6|nr:hypothetical protein [Burkholderia ambifaria]MBR8220257.1 hypothetical protein [Burkholderia ambifaria]
MTVELDRVLDNALRDALEKNGELGLMRAIIVKYRDQGFGSDSVCALLDAMRNGAAEECENKIIELMDIVSGFCRPDMRVW